MYSFKFSASAFASSMTVVLPGFSQALTSLVSALRFLFVGAFPLFGLKLFEKLGVDWGIALLAFLVLGLGLPLLLLVSMTLSLSCTEEDILVMPMQLYLFGPKLRKLGAERMDKFVGSAKR